MSCKACPKDSSQFYCDLANGDPKLDSRTAGKCDDPQNQLSQLAVLRRADAQADLQRTLLKLGCD